jgi:hypothetical protein
LALDNSSYEITCVLDLETGDILHATDEDRRELEDIYAEIVDVNGDEHAAFEAALIERDLPDWRRDSLREVARIEAGFGGRFRPIQAHDPHAGYRDMEAFIGTVEDENLGRRLERAMGGRGAFRYFRDTLLDYPAERERWFQLENDRERQRALDWLRAEGIEPIAE